MSEVSPDAQDFALWLSGYADAVPGAIPAEVCDRLAVVIGALVARRLRAPSISNPFDRDVTEQTFGPLADKKLRIRDEGSLPEGLEPFMDAEGRFTQWPVKQSLQLAIVADLVHTFEPGRRYTEREVNDLLDTRHTFRDAALLRRLLVELGYIERRPDGAAYWLHEDADGPLAEPASAADAAL